MEYLELCVRRCGGLTGHPLVFEVTEFQYTKAFVVRKVLDQRPFAEERVRLHFPAMPAELGYIAPFFIVRDVIVSIAFYKDLLGFEVTFLGPDDDPYFAMLKRDGVRLMLKAITPEVQPAPNPSRHPWARWDAYIHTIDPDALAEEFASRGVSFREPLGINSDNLRGFEVMDVDGYVIYFGRPA